MEAFVDTSVPWYIHEAPKLQPEFRELITNYTNIQPQDVEKHVQKVRDKAWRVVSHPIPPVLTTKIRDLPLTTPLPRPLSPAWAPTSSPSSP